MSMAALMAAASGLVDATRSSRRSSPPKVTETRPNPRWASRWVQVSAWRGRPGARSESRCERARGPGFRRGRLEHQHAVDSEAGGDQIDQPFPLVGVQPLDRTAQHQTGERLVGDHVEMLEYRFGAHIQTAIRPRPRQPTRPDRRRTHRCRPRPGPRGGTRSHIRHGAPDRRHRSARPPPPPTTRSGRCRPPGTALGGSPGSAAASTAASRTSIVVDHDVEHPGNRPRELHHLMDDEAHVPAQRLADQALDIAAHQLLGLDRNGDVHVGRSVHQGQGLAEPGPTVRSRPARTRGTARRVRARGRRGDLPKPAAASPRRRCRPSRRASTGAGSRASGASATSFDVDPSAATEDIEDSAGGTVRL